MNQIDKLRIVSALKELDFVISEYEYKKAISDSNSEEFQSEIFKILDTNNDLKKHVDKKTENILGIEVNIEVNDHGDLLESPIKKSDGEDEDKRIKSLFRKISKCTHPDKNSGNLRVFFEECKEAYENKDLYRLFILCEKLKISYECTPVDLENIEDDIETIKERISFLESTYPWKWKESKDHREKSDVLFDYIQKIVCNQ